MIALWILMSVGIGAIAANNGRSFLGWTALSLLLSPIVGLIAVLVMGKQE
jgi:tetrahydromethanopterin S-methyltransferase subunit C